MSSFRLIVPKKLLIGAAFLLLAGTISFGLPGFASAAPGQGAIGPGQGIQHSPADFGDDCTPQGTFFLGFPHWYQYLDGIVDAHGACLPRIHGLNDIWLIAAAIIEILLRVAAIVAVIFVIYGGFSYTTSQGDPEGTKNAKNTLVNALVGLAIAVTAAAAVSFIAKSIS